MSIEHEMIREILSAARRLARRYPAAFRRDPQLRERLARLLRRNLPGARPPGRPRSAPVALAVELRRKGEPWERIYPLAIPFYATLDKHERLWRCNNLRRAVRAVLRRDRKRRGVSIPAHILCTGAAGSGDHTMQDGGAFHDESRTGTPA